MYKYFVKRNCFVNCNYSQQENKQTNNDTLNFMQHTSPDKLYISLDFHTLTICKFFFFPFCAHSEMHTKRRLSSN